MIHGRYLVRESNVAGARPLLVGFHGYGETAENLLHQIDKIPITDQWLCCSIQALHSFYNRDRNSGASWLTSADREIRITENVDYINRVIASIKSEYAVTETIVYWGFSQGTAMACRAAMLCEPSPGGVMILGGDIPPEFDMIDRMRRILIGRGGQDHLYPIDKWNHDLARIRKSNLDVRICTFDGGHEWHHEYCQRSNEFLAGIVDGLSPDIQESG